MKYLKLYEYFYPNSLDKVKTKIIQMAMDYLLEDDLKSYSDLYSSLEQIQMTPEELDQQVLDLLGRLGLIQEIREEMKKKIRTARLLSRSTEDPKL